MILGMYGQVGWELCRSLGSIAPTTAIARQDVDLLNEDELRSAIRRLAPTIIVNAAAYTAVDQAETETALAAAVNTRAVRIIAEETARLRAWLVHYSTDYVFDGEQEQPYDEEDAPRPLSVYGHSKLAGERHIADVGCNHLVLRCGWVYSLRRTNFLLSILKLAMQRDGLRVIDDCVGAPTGAAFIADVTAGAVRRILEGEVGPDRSGLYHLAAGGGVSWHRYAGFIVKTARSLGMPIRVDPARIEPVGERAYGAPARRPLNSLLDTRKIRRTFGVTLPGWQIGVERALCNLAESRVILRHMDPAG